jgi:hypothetical protein
VNDSARISALTAAALSIVALTGCGMPGAPLPPSLNLPNRVADLTAIRTGNEVRLAWTVPTKNTDKLLLKAPVAARICRNQAGASGCSAIAMLQLAPGVAAAYTDALPPELAAGLPRPLTYFVELDNRKGRAAGLSNPAPVLAGQAPGAVENLSAKMRRDGIVLRWTASPSDASTIRLVRTLVTPPTQKPEQGPLAPPAEPLQRNLLVESSRSGRALDAEIRFGRTYEYRAQRLARVTVDGKTVELAGSLSAPIRIAAINLFPPAVPKELAAVATIGQAGSGPAIDLNWQPNVEADLAGYIVYRREAGETNNSWRRISSAQPVVGPGFHDPDVQPGHTYTYAVSAIDQDGHESARSTSAQETVPGP